MNTGVAGDQGESVRAAASSVCAILIGTRDLRTSSGPTAVADHQRPNIWKQPAGFVIVKRLDEGGVHICSARSRRRGKFRWRQVAVRRPGCNIPDADDRGSKGRTRQHPRSLPVRCRLRCRCGRWRSEASGLGRRSIRRAGPGEAAEASVRTEAPRNGCRPVRRARRPVRPGRVRARP